MTFRPFATTLFAASIAVISGGVHAQMGGYPSATPAPSAQRPARAETPAAPAAAIAPAAATAPAAPVDSPVAIPPNTCVKPEYPGKLGSALQFNAFNKDFNAYGACVKKYVDGTKAIINAAVTAGNGAVEDFNKFAADIKDKDEASKN